MINKIEIFLLKGECFMGSEYNSKSLILIADDSEMNRSILADMLENEYDIIEAEDGIQAIKLIELHKEELSLILLDIVMPKADGFEVLDKMNGNGLINKIPVIMISAENKPSAIDRAYKLGATDFISRPFDALIVHRRVINTILLYTKQKKLIQIAAKQVLEKERQSLLMIEILSHIVEFRNGESGMHVRHVRIFTEILLNKLAKRTDIHFTRNEIATISTASALHDIGKIAIPEEILNKPAALTDKEFAVIKTHSLIGAKMLYELPIDDDDPLISVAYEICRWHHERYDGGGYPDGLKGDAIPISAQIVSLADVYDALTSDRVYKKAIPHSQAIKMIINGECGKFNPILLECLKDMEEELASRFEENLIYNSDGMAQAHSIVEEIMRQEETTVSKRTVSLLENERMKIDFFASLTNDIQFEYSAKTREIKLSPSSAKILGFPEIISEPRNNEKLFSLIDTATFEAIVAQIRETTPQSPKFRYDFEVNFENEKRWFRLIARTLWQSAEPPVFSGFIGKAFDIHDSRKILKDLEKKASTDALTGLLNHAGAKEIIKSRLHSPIGKAALVIFDLDRFKQANDNYGHLFGDKVLAYTADKLSRSIRKSDVIARVGGDEFLIFLEYKSNIERIVKRIFESLSGEYEDFHISLSMGVATTDVVGNDYDTLFDSADKALYTTKRSGSGSYRFYDDSIHEIFSVISPIESEGGRDS